MSREEGSNFEEKNNRQITEPVRKPFSAPNLIIYGALRDLTSGGIGSDPEGDKSGSGGSPFKRA